MTLNSENYGGREQTFAKHFFLDRYLERVAYNLFASQSFDVFTYVDGFSGPWQSANEKREDTSFVIALNKLRGVRNGLSRQGRRIKIRCLFIEKDRQAFQELEKVIGEYPRDIEIQVICGEFENQIATITNFIDKTFSFVFIDPTGWTGFGLDIIRPLLQLRGEILINFMFDEINRFLDDSRSEIRTSYDRLFGGGGWRDEIREGEKIYGMRREDAVLHVYQERLRKAGNFEHVTSTRILKTLAERSYFHLVYATRHWKGLVEFREVEKKAILEQGRIRTVAKHQNREEKTGMSDLYGPSDQVNLSYGFTDRQKQNFALARRRFDDLVTKYPRVQFSQILGALLQIPYVTKSNASDIAIEMRNEGQIAIEGMKPKERVVKPMHFIVRQDPGAAKGG